MDATLLEKFYKSIGSAIRQKGKRINSDKGVIVVNQTIAEVNFMVISEAHKNFQYNVVLQQYKNRIISECNCAFYSSHESPCKHIAAAAEVYIARMGSSKPAKVAFSNVDNSKPTKGKFNSLDISLPLEPITLAFVTKYSTPHNFSTARNDGGRVNYKINIQEYWRDHIVAEVNDKGNSFHAMRVEIDVKNDVLHLKCECMQTVAALCSHKHILLQYLSKEFKEPDFLKKFPSYNDLLDAALEPYGFSHLDKKVDKLFKIEFKKGEFVASPREKGILKKNIDNSFIRKFSETLRTINIPLDGVQNSKNFNENYSTAYAFSAPEISVRPTIEVLYGVVNPKTGLLSKHINTKIESLTEGLPIPELTTHQKEIEDLITTIQNVTLAKEMENSGSLAVRVSCYNEYLSKLIPLLKTEKVYFCNNGYTYSKTSLRPVTIAEESPRFEFSLVQDQSFLVLSLKLYIQDRPVDFDEVDLYMLYFYYINDKLYFFNSSEDISYLLLFLETPELKVHESGADNFLKEFVLPITKKYKVIMKLKKKIVKKAATNPKFEIYLSEQGNFLLIKPIVVYAEGEVELFSDELLFKSEAKNYVEYNRDDAAESEIKNFLLPLHPDFTKQEHRGFFYVHFDKIFEDNWYFDFFSKIRTKEMAVFGLDKIKRVSYTPYKPIVNTKVRSGIDWFDIDMTVSYGDQRASLKEIQKALFRKDKYIQLSDGSKGLLPEEWIEKYAHIFRTGEIGKDGNLKVSKLHFNVLDTLLMESDQTEILKELHEKKQKLMQFDKIKSHKIPKGIKATLRPYQLEGYNWLMFLDEFGWGGCLADDMGLGKTLQMICFLKKQIDLHPRQINLVIMPTTLVFNWKRELEKFAPDIEFLIYTGTTRNKEKIDFNQYNLVLTTYGLVINDIEHLRKKTFNYVVLDESQAIKNPSSQRFKAVNLLKSRGKIVMTGTPVENNTFDLYAQMSFTNPGLLGNITHFQNHFSQPIDKHADQSVALTLRKLISPFMLRRTKEQVATDLPDKTEDIIMCEMKDEQRRVYNAFRDNYREMILNKVDEEGLGKSSMMVLDAILKLRQICNSPALLNTKEDFGTASIKIEELSRHLSDKTGNHKVLVFSQFTQMLKLIEKELQKLHLKYEYLDGQTPAKERENKVQIFKEDEAIRVFLISLKAGGVGLNLTEADYVYLIDPWWNPAVEAQAIDRTHRIGQAKKVFAYRMICKETIEEKVLQLQQKKRKVASDIISTEASFYKQLDKEDIADLFS